MQVVIIGSGNVASVLGRLCQKNGHQILQVLSRSAAHAGSLAAELNCPFGNLTEKMSTEADLYLVAISDEGLTDLGGLFKTGNKLVLHTAGSVSKEVLHKLSDSYGVLYPLQSLRREMAYTADIPFLIDGNNEETKTRIGAFARTLSSNVTMMNDADRLKLHVAAVVVSNFTNHLYTLAEEFCRKEGIEFKLLIPLIKETAARIELLSPADVQTGPAARNDIFTIEKHLEHLADYPRLKDAYSRLTDSIRNK